MARAKILTEDDERLIATKGAIERNLTNEGVPFEKPAEQIIEVKEGMWTPSKSKSEHSAIWGYARMDTAFKMKPKSPLQKIWESNAQGLASSMLPCDAIQPIIARFRKKQGWRVPKTQEEILDMYDNPKNWG